MREGFAVGRWGRMEPSKPFSDRLRNGDSLGRVFVIHTMHVDTTDTRPHGRDRAEDQALSERSDRRGMGPYRAAAAEAEPPRAQAERDDARGSERDPLHDALGRRMAHAAEGLPALADGLLVVPALCAVDAVPDHPRHRLDDGPGA